MINLVFVCNRRPIPSTDVDTLKVMYRMEIIEKIIYIDSENMVMIFLSYLEFFLTK